MNKYKIIIGTFCIFFSAGLVYGFVSSALAETSPPEPVIFAEKAIRANQDYIAKHRAIVEEWNRRKENNAVQTGILNAYGYKYNWESNKAVESFTQR